MSTVLRWLVGAAAMALLWWLAPIPEGAWWAMPPLLAVAAYVGAQYALVAGVGTVVFAGLTVGNLIFIASAVYGVYSAKSQARKAARAARDAYNASLVDRTVTVATSEAPWQIVYGEATVGGFIAAILTSGDKDQYKHVVVAWATHECEAISEIYLNGVALGPLDVNGNVTGGKWLKGETHTGEEFVTISAGGSFTLTQQVAKLHTISLSVGNVEDRSQYLDASQVTIGGATLTVNPEHLAAWAGQYVRVTYDWATGDPMVRVQHHLGSTSQAANAALIAECPEDWSATDQGKGICYSVFRLDLNEPEFQGGPPQLSAKIKGKRLYDHRSGLTVWTNNAALCNSDFIRAEYGKSALSTQVGWASFDAAANACDETPAGQAGQKRYTINGAVRTDQDPDTTLDHLCQAMAGFATFDGGWQLQAGTYTAPVMALTDADNLGSIEVIADSQGDQVSNGMRGRFYDPSRYDQLTDYPPYQNAALVTEDGGALWADLSLPYTNTSWRAHNLARIQVERSRGMQLVYPAKMRAVRLKVGQRVTLSNSMLGMSSAVFRLVKREYSLGRAVMLYLAQDDPSMYDEADAPASLPSPAASGADPWVVAPVQGLAANSGNATLLKTADGTVLGRVRLSYAASADAYVRSGGALEIQYRPVGTETWQRAPDAAGESTEAYLLGLEEPQLYVIRVRWRNGLGAVGRWMTVSVLHLGKSLPPSDVTGLDSVPVIGGVSPTWDPCTDLDYEQTELRVGPSWDDPSTIVIWSGAASSYAWATAPGTYHVMARHRDSSGNYSTGLAELNLVVSASAATAGLMLDVGAAAFVLPASSAGVVSSYAGASASVRVLAAGLDDSAAWTFARTNGPGVSSTLAAGTLTLTTLADAVDASYIDCSATRSGYATLTRRLLVSKAKAGATGTNGTNGTNGLNGSNGSDGANGANGTRTADARVFAWALSVPAGPTGTGTYTWATGAVSAAPAGWTLTPGTAAAGFSLYAATVRLSNTNTTATDTINWTGAAVAPLSAPGASGAAGDSARIAYTVVASGSTLGTGTRTSTGSTSVPATGAWGLGEAWQNTAPAYGASQTVWQANGIYNPAANTITWDSPYISALKVGSLSAISANLGTVTAGTITGITINGTTITGGVLQTATSGQRVVLNEGGTNTMRLYASGGAGEELISHIGPATYSGVNAVARFGSNTGGNSATGAFGISSSGSGVRGVSSSGNGVAGISSSGAGVLGNSNTVGVYGEGPVGVDAFSTTSGTAVRANGGVNIQRPGGGYDPYGVCSVTCGTAGSYSYYGLTRASQIPWGIGIDTSNNFIVGIPSPGHLGTISSPLLSLNTGGTLKISGYFGCNGVTPPARATLPAAGGDALVNAIRQALINCGICQ